VLAGFMADRTHLNLASPCTADPVHFSAVSVALCEGATYDWDFPGGTVLAIEGPDAWVVYDTPGNFDVTLAVTDATGGTDAWTWTGMMEVVNEPVVDATGFSENFDGDQFPPQHWRLEVNGHAWEHAWDLVDSENGVAQFPNYWVDTQGAEDLLITPAFDPTGMDVLTFDVAHQVYASYVDGLEVWGRPGGSDGWTILWSAYGSDLAVDDCYTWFWYDTGGSIAWENHAVALPEEWIGGDVTCLELAFVNVGGYGNHTWIDNVNLGSTNSVQMGEAPMHAQLFPNPNAGSCTLLVPEHAVGAEFIVIDRAGRVVVRDRLSSARTSLNLPLAPGMYTLQVDGLSAIHWAIR